MYADTLFFESFSQDSDHGRRNYDDIALLQRTWSEKSHAVEARAAGGDRDLVHALATFLVGASPHTYFGSSFSPGWGCADGWLDAMNASTPQAKLFSKPLGAPLGGATNQTSVYTRRFAAGTDVWLNHTAGGKKGLGWAACIFWADGETSAWGAGASACKKPGFQAALRLGFQASLRGGSGAPTAAQLKTDDGHANAAAAACTIDNTRPRTDTGGEIVNAHQGHITRFKQTDGSSRFFWVGSAWVSCKENQNASNGCGNNHDAMAWGSATALFPPSRQSLYILCADD